MRIGSSIGPLLSEPEEVPEEFDFVEISIGEQEVEPREIDFKDISEQLAEKDLDVVIHLPFHQPLATEVELFNEAVIEYFEQLIEETELDFEKAVVHANMRDQNSQTQKNRLREQVEKLDRLARKKDVEICFENVEHAGTPELFELGSLLEEVGASMCLDIGHAFIQTSEEEIARFIGEYGDIVSHLHVHDVRDRGDTHLSIGDGWMNYKPICEPLESFDGTATLELFTDDNDYIQLSRRKFLDNFQQ